MILHTIVIQLFWGLVCSLQKRTTSSVFSLSLSLSLSLPHFRAGLPRELWLNQNKSDSQQPETCSHLGVSINVGPAKWLVYSEKSHLEIDDLGVPLFQEHFRTTLAFIPRVGRELVLRHVRLPIARGERLCTRGGGGLHRH